MVHLQNSAGLPYQRQRALMEMAQHDRCTIYRRKQHAVFNNWYFTCVLLYIS